jgi:N-acetylmuramoyl-L-alanine amidase
MNVVCIDAGHGGADPGAVGNALREKDINLDIARRLRSILQRCGIGVVMTRESDVAVGLAERCRIANVNRVDLFVSIHVNAGGGTGVEVFIVGVGGRAEVCAKKVLPHLVKDCGFRNRGVKVNNFQVLRDTAMPAILTENGFIDHSSDVSKLTNPVFIQTIAEAHAKGICEYFGVAYKAEAPTPAPTLDKDIYLSVRVLQSKSDALIKEIHSMGYACKRLDLA